MLTLPPEIDPATLVDILKAGSSPTHPTPTTTDIVGMPTSTSIDANETPPDDLKSGGKKLVSESNPALSFTVDGEMVKKYGLAVICLLGANVLIGLILLVLGVLGCIRRGSSRKAAARDAAPTYAPVKSVDYDEAYVAPSYQKQYS